MTEPSTQQTSEATVIPAAVVGYAVLAFPNRPTGKANIDNVKAAMRKICCR